MKQLAACFKKDYMETVRTSRFWIMLASSLGIAAIVMVILVVMDLMGFGEASGSLSVMLKPNFYNSTNLFNAVMSTYFIIIMVVMYCNFIGKEITTKKWLNPISSGIKTRNMVISRLTTGFLSIIIAFIVGCMLHFIFTISYCESGGAGTTVFEIPNILRSYGLMLVYVVFISLMTLTLNAMLRRGTTVAVIVIVSMILIPEILGAIQVGEQTLVNYTPFAFMNEAIPQSFAGLGSSNSLGVAEWITSSLITAALCIGMSIGAISKSKIKAYEK